MGAGVGTLAEPPAVDSRIGLVIAQIDQAMEWKLPLRELARTAGVSLSRLSHLLQSVVGTSPARYLKAARMGRAKALLETSRLNVKEVAARAGFSHIGRFSGDFRKAYGLAPSQYCRAEAQRVMGDQPPRAAIGSE
jgi:transcriptional regulator GlxA family with amidase domain